MNMMILLAARKYYYHDDASKILRKYLAGLATSLGYCKFQMAASLRSWAGNVQSFLLGLEGVTNLIKLFLFFLAMEMCVKAFARMFSNGT